MESGIGDKAALPQALIDEVEALAKAQQRPAREVLREAVEFYVREYRAPADTDLKRTPQEGAARMLVAQRQCLA